MNGQSDSCYANLPLFMLLYFGRTRQVVCISAFTLRVCIKVEHVVILYIFYNIAVLVVVT